MIYFSSIFLILHGIVFFLYAGQSARLFELKPGMTWPDNSWFMSKVLDIKILRIFTATLCSVFGIAFFLSGILLIFKISFWHNLALYSSIGSIFFYVQMWDGKSANIKDQGGIGILLNLFIVLVLIFFY